MSATPRPWRKSRNKSVRSVDEFGGFHVAQARIEDDAELIVRAVNAHDDLVAAAEQMRRWCIPNMHWTDEIGQALLVQMDAALAKARGESA